MRHQMKLIRSADLPLAQIRSLNSMLRAKIARWRTMITGFFIVRQFDYCQN